MTACLDNISNAYVTRKRHGKTFRPLRDDMAESTAAPHRIPIIIHTDETTIEASTPQVHAHFALFCAEESGWSNWWS